MTNNEKLKIIQMAFNLEAEQIANICFCSPNTVITWRSGPDTKRYRNMPMSKWANLESYLIKQRLVKNEAELERLLEEYSKQPITEDD